MSKRMNLGELEELILLTVGVLANKAYSVAIKEELEVRQGRTISLGALHTVLYRLERKGHLDSKLGESTKVRGGKPKRYFSVTTQGQRLVFQIRESRRSLWKDISTSSFPSINHSL